MSELAWLAQIDAWDPVAGAAVALRATNVNDPRVCHLDGQTWWPAIAALPRLRYDFFDGAFGGQIVAPTGQIRLVAEPFPTLARISFGDARFRLWRGTPGDAFGAYVLTFDGRITAQPDITDGFAAFGVGVDDRWLDLPLLKTYAGTGSAEGPAELEGQVKPLALGTPRFAPGVLIDPVDLIYQLHHGAIEQVEMAFERANRFGAPVADYASFAALDAATIANGAYATCLTLGLVRFGAPPDQPLAFHLKGDKPGAPARAQLPGALIGRIAAIAGATSIATASLTALDAARPYPLSVVIAEQTTAREVIQGIAASVNAVAGIGWTGALWVRAIPDLPGTATIALDATGAALPPTANVQQLPVAAPWSVLAIEAERSWVVHALSDVAFTATLTPRGAYDAATVYREGDIVTTADGAQWLFIATSPASGITPSPATSATWAAYGDAVAANWSDVVDDDGTRPDPNADVTADQTPSVTGLTVIEIAADSGGVTTTTLPMAFRIVAMLGTTNVSATSTFALGTLPGGVTATIDTVTDRGLGSITVADSGGPIPVTVTFPNGYTTTVIKPVNRTIAAPTGGGGAGATDVVDYSWTSPAGSTHSQVSDTLTVRSTSGGTLRFSASGSFTPFTALFTNAAIKAGYRLAGSGGAFTDFAAEVSGSGTASLDDVGYVAIVEQTKTGLTASTDYEVALFARRVNAARGFDFFDAVFRVRQ